MQRYKSKNGITLIALVITIIVLLILAGVSITMLTGDNSILNQATNAKQRTGEGTEAEQVKIAAMAAVADSTVNLRREIDKAKLEEELQKYFSGATVSEDGDDYIYEGQYKTYRISKTGTVTEEAPSAVSIKLTLTHENETITADETIVDDVVENVPIPVGFHHVTGTEKAKGLVIESDDSTKNQFVWVPVDQGQTLTLEVTTEETISAIKLTRPDGTEEDITAGGKNQTISMKNETETVYLNGVYTVEVTTTNNTKTAQKRVSSLYGQEIEAQTTPTVNQLKAMGRTVYSTTEELLEAKSANSLEELLQNASQDSIVMYMVMNGIYVEDQEEAVKQYVRKVIGSQFTDNNQQQASAEKYGGFYIARYEAGDGTVSSKRTDSTEEHTVVSKKGAYVYDYVTRSQAITLAASMYNTTAVKSQLITGAGWDRTLNWIVETDNGLGENEVMVDSKDWGNYNNSTKDTDKAGSSNMNFTTGRSDNWRANNIYDLAGNTSEWTNETFSDSGSPCVGRGGYCSGTGATYPASVRVSSDEDYSDDYISFRVSLYLQT